LGELKNDSHLGPKVVSKVITTHSIRVVANVLKRKPVIWDNIHANDYDQRRLFLGPYDGRPIHLYTHLRGILTNPNCEFESNFIAIHTLSTWIKCARVTFFGEEEACPRITSNTKETKDIIEPMEDESVVDSNLSGNQSESKDLGVDSKEEKIDSTMDTDIEPTASPVVIEPVLPKSITILKAYDPEQAVKLAVTEWLQEFRNPKSANTYAKSGTFSVVNNSTPVQSTASIPTQTDVTSAILKDSVKVISTPSPVKVAKEKSRNKTKKDMEAERKVAVYFYMRIFVFHFVRFKIYI
jgi:protein O-GlcNAcase/histone acetyltransferase